MKYPVSTMLITVPTPMYPRPQITTATMRMALASSCQVPRDHPMRSLMPVFSAVNGSTPTPPSSMMAAPRPMTATPTRA